MNAYDFKNQVAVVTGGANGIGYSVAERLSKSGAAVKIWDLDFEVAQKAADTINAEAIQCNITDWKSYAFISFFSICHFLCFDCQFHYFKGMLLRHGRFTSFNNIN